MGDNMPDNVVFTQWADQFSQGLVNETFKFFDGQTKNKGGEKAAQFVAMMFLAKFVGTMLLRTLNKKPNPKDTNEEICKNTMEGFADAKLKVQDAVSAGFQGAMSMFTGKPIEYYCQVKPVPEAANKHPV